MAQILVIEPNSVSQSTIREILAEHNISIVSNATSAIKEAAINKPDLVILEMSLAGHSGMEFLYEFRSYNDWKEVPIIIYSSLKLGSEVLESRSWKHLKIYDYLYKPEVSLALLKSIVEQAMAKS
jgi:CheY-like chemotaxis protein